MKLTEIIRQKLFRKTPEKSPAIERTPSKMRLTEITKQQLARITGEKKLSTANITVNKMMTNDTRDAQGLWENYNRELGEKISINTPNKAEVYLLEETNRKTETYVGVRTEEISYDVTFYALPSYRLNY